MALAYLRLAALVAAGSARLVTINNTAPRLDTSGQIVDGHDLSLRVVVDPVSGETTYVMHTIEYGLCVAPLPLGCSPTPDDCGARLDHNVSVFSSPDLSAGSWTFEGLALAASARRRGILYRPHVVYSAQSRQWVLWANVHEIGVFQGYIAATAAHIAGPYTVAAPAVNLTRVLATNNCGDFDLWVDDDGAGWVIYTCGHVMGVEQLAPDFLSAAGGAATIFPTYFVEAPVLFRRGNLYYALFGSCCCFCRQGSGAMVHTAPHPPI
jgi:hypothetical protein